MLAAAQAVDQPAHFVQRAGAAQVIPVAGQRRAAGRTRFLLHDQGALDAGLQPVQLLLARCPRPAASTRRGSRRAFPGRGSALGAGVAEHAAAVAKRVLRGVDAVAQAAPLADFGEQPALMPPLSTPTAPQA